MPELRLYYCPGHMSFAPHVLLHEIGEPFQAVKLDIKAGDTQRPEFLRVNPKGKVPVLLADDAVLTESTAIMYFLALTFRDRQFIPMAPMAVGRTIEWTNWLSGILASAVGQVTHPGRFSTDEAAHDGVRRKGRENLESAYRQIDDWLTHGNWALQDGYSIVDPQLLIFFKWGHVLNLDMSRFPHWCAHTQAMEARPAVQAALRAEGISIRE